VCEAVRFRCALKRFIVQYHQQRLSEACLFGWWHDNLQTAAAATPLQLERHEYLEQAATHTRSDTSCANWHARTTTASADWPNSKRVSWFDCVEVPQLTGAFHGHISESTCRIPVTRDSNSLLNSSGGTNSPRAARSLTLCCCSHHCSISDCWFSAHTYVYTQTTDPYVRRPRVQPVAVAALHQRRYNALYSITPSTVQKHTHSLSKHCCSAIRDGRTY
jgi:hypothetical protein